MTSAQVVTSPDGDRWRVRRRWLNRGLPSLRRGFREAKRERDDGVLDAAGMDGISGWAIAAVLGLVALIVLPVIGLALELVVLVAILAAGLVGRVALGRPWTVEARNLDDGERSVAFGVRGFRQAGDAVEELAAALSASGPPERLAAGERTLLPRPNF